MVKVVIDGMSLMAIGYGAVKDVNTHKNAGTRMLEHECWNTTAGTRLLEHDCWNTTTGTRLLEHDCWNTDAGTRMKQMLEHE
jgi:hypothetical protein